VNRRFGIWSDFKIRRTISKIGSTGSERDLLYHPGNRENKFAICNMASKCLFGMKECLFTSKYCPERFTILISLGQAILGVAG
jgi:hypothetical protein